MISRRCAQRQFLLRPSERTDQAFLYCFALAARRCGIDVYWLMVMSNHYHAGIHDRHGRYPEFLRYFHSLVARCLNCHHVRWENFWSTEQTGALHLGAERKEKGVPVLGRKAVRRQSPFSCPKTCVDRRVLRPRVATKNKWLRIEMLSRNKRFQQRYRQAYARRRAGDSGVLFPFGSYQLQVLGLVRCEAPPPG